MSQYIKWDLQPQTNMEKNKCKTPFGNKKQLAWNEQVNR